MAGKYQQLKNQIAKLEKEAAAARKVEAAEAVATIQALMAEFDLTAEDLGFKLVRKTAKAKSASTPKYRDPQTGKTWTGRGKPPAWMTAAIAAGTKEALLIEKVAAPASATRKRTRVSKVEAASATEVPAVPKNRRAKAAAKKATAKPAAQPKAPKRPRKKASTAMPAEATALMAARSSEQVSTAADDSVTA